jgi:Rrf2 family transcriptional regulator, iron-sulfur cluster assembly transcription factor
MRLTTRGRFAVAAMLDLALTQVKMEAASPINLNGISQRQSISLSYLEQLFAKLRRSGLVDSTRGPGGGYVLARDAFAISVAEVIAAVDEPIDATQCGGQKNCKGKQQPCITHHLWEGLNQQIVGYLSAVTLGRLVEDSLSRGADIAGAVSSISAVLSPTSSKSRSVQSA